MNTQQPDNYERKEDNAQKKKKKKKKTNNLPAVVVVAAAAALLCGFCGGDIGMTDLRLLASTNKSRPAIMLCLPV